MDKRSWPWKKKSSHKTVTIIDSNVGFSTNSQDNSKKPAVFVQVSQERYDHLSGLEDHIKLLNEKLSTALSEVTTKENLVKQHAKVAEEAVTGWEKAESEASALKVQLESVALSKLTAEERISQLDGALKECVKQIRAVKEESEQKLHDVIFANNKQWEKVKDELESRIGAYEQELLQCSAENERLSGSLEERSNMLMKINKEKCQADSEIEALKTNIQSYQREISSLKYEVHIVSKELEIRTEEKNMSMRSAEVSNKQHLEDVKKISKLESECQRLRSLVRKKLPGPAALAQMKFEVEGFSRDYRDSRVPRSPARNSSPRLSSASEFALENMHQCQKDNEFLTTRLLEMEEETKMLKEALSKRNSELQVSRSMFSKAASKLRTLEDQGELDQQKYQMRSSIHNTDGLYGSNGSNQYGITSMSEDGIDEDTNCSEKWSSMLISENISSKKGKPMDKISIISSSSHMELMDDFLEMEKLACSSVESVGALSVSGDKGKFDSTVYDLQILSPCKSDQHQKAESLSPNLRNYSKAILIGESKCDSNKISVSRIISKLVKLIESSSNEKENTEKILNTIKSVVFDVQAELGQHPENYIGEEVESVDASCDKNPYQDATNAESGIRLSVDKPVTTEDVKDSISKIRDFVLWFSQEHIQMQGLEPTSQEPSQNVKDFTCYINTFLSENMDLPRFTMALSCVLSEIKELDPHVSYDKTIEGDCTSSECVDKVTLLENIPQELPNNRCLVSSLDHSASQGSLSPGFGQKHCSHCEQLKQERSKLVLDLDTLSENLDQTKCQLLGKEKEITELKSQLAVSQNSNSLAETQLKCVVESYKLMECRYQEFEIEVSILKTKAETLENELEEERLTHQKDLDNLKHLQDQLERNEQCTISEAVEMKEKQEREIAAAADKLAECQETIFLLGRQLKALHSQPEIVCSPSEKTRVTRSIMDDLSIRSGSMIQGSPHTSQRSGLGETENLASILRQTGGESPFCNPGFSQSDSELSSDLQSPTSAKRPKHRSSLSSSSSSPVIVNGQKQVRGFSRFFSMGK